MIALIQRVTRAGVEVVGQSVGAIGPGLLALVGVAAGDTPASAERLLERAMQQQGLTRCLGRSANGRIRFSEFLLRIKRLHK